jgi:hypothetical protein
LPPFGRISGPRLCCKDRLRDCGGGTSKVGDGREYLSAMSERDPYILEVLIGEMREH